MTDATTVQAPDDPGHAQDPRAAARADPAASTAGWQLDDDAARAYQHHLVPAIFDRLARRLVEVAEVAPGDRVLDVACGTGVVARAAGRVVGDSGRVVGVDVNESMLATARALDDGITYLAGIAESLPVGDDQVDVVTCQQALQFLPDPVAAVAEMRRVAVPGGRVAFSVLRGLAANPVYEVFRSALERHAGAEAGRMIASPFGGGDGEALRETALAAGLEQVTVRIAVDEERFPSVSDFVHHEAASSPLAVELARLDEGRRTALVDDLESRLASHQDDLGLVFANETWIVTARA
ncbi:methyltransferase domain-containing protein [Salsipaludibacter albus]|uniref:methyltransferase domain-containing protein n=1 Tax=Salsipaludibacter albus TaxID=2849650 RepID=UPI001EE4B4ED|nr:methyltransferase domain-containing protein [Salsipaludibacter albus]MBY5161515.1 methyltransferase domain-containing protein [Salsipaludibacter albus]